MGVYIEHCNGRFPLFFSPYQIALLPVSEDSQLERCRSIADEIMKEFRGDLHVDVFPHETYYCVLMCFSLDHWENEFVNVQ